MAVGRFVTLRLGGHGDQDRAAIPNRGTAKAVVLIGKPVQGLQAPLIDFEIRHLKRPQFEERKAQSILKLNCQE